MTVFKVTSQKCLLCLIHRKSCHLALKTQGLEELRCKMKEIMRMTRHKLLGSMLDRVVVPGQDLLTKVR